MTDAERLQRTLARLVGTVMRGGLVEPGGRDPRREATVAEAEQLLQELNTPAEFYRYPLPQRPRMRPLQP